MTTDTPQPTEEKKIRNGTKVWYRYNRKCKWKAGFAAFIDYTRTLPFGIREIVKVRRLGKTKVYRPFAFRVKAENIKTR